MHTMSVKDQINPRSIPQHIAIIMDGNGRWAKSKGKLRVFGHRQGVESVRSVLEACVELEVQYLTLYAFSSENWNRPKLEVLALMELLVSSVAKEAVTMMKHNVRLQAIGNLEMLPEKGRRLLEKTMLQTAENTGTTLVLALSYSAREEITRAVRNTAKLVQSGELSLESISEEVVISQLYTKHIPDPELLIRTSGECRISNFLLWQLAYAELYFTRTLWPDFGKEDLYTAILDFQQRERRFGRTSEQIAGMQES